MRTIVYVDGFNLYFRQLKGAQGVKWLNIKELAESLLNPSNNVVAVNYYSARVSGKRDPSAPGRQQVYFEALDTIPEISIHYGSFLTSTKFASLAHPPEFRPLAVMGRPWPDVVRIIKTEEKGSDVNLASHLVRDGYTNAFDVAVVISNDSDLVEPIRIVTEEIGKPVGLLSPVSNANIKLRDVSTFVRRIRKKHLRSNQFPDPLPRNPDPDLHQPPSWA